ncbi:tripartite motif-containing protein 2-like [Mytilus trossulus]|uniref:tripartite motif-containing protein 2-like n=1 Tax=Mytilus trossulus TaxID=6551 RepID=UPI003003E3DD
MASPSKDFCTLCKENVSSDADTWCAECDVFLCVECEKHHKGTRSSKDHTTISAENYHELPSFIKETSNICKIHDRKLELYCSVHACACCLNCVTGEHQTCQTMKPLSDILEQVKSSDAVPQLEKELKDREKHIEEIKDYLRNRIIINAMQKTEAIQNIQAMRKSIDDHLNKLEQELLKDLEIEHSKLKPEIETLLHEVDKRAKQIKNLQNDFANMTKYATELQTYVGLKQIKNITSQERNYIDDLKRGSNLNKRNLHVTTSPDIASILHDVKSFGEITVDTRPCNIQENVERKDQAQYLVLVPTMDQIKPSFSNKLNVPLERSLRIADCCILPDCNCLIADSVSKDLLLFKNNGSFIRTVLSFEKTPGSVCFVKDGTVAVSFDGVVALVDINKSQVDKTFKFPEVYCSGVSSEGHVLVISMPYEKNVIVMNLLDESKQNLEGICVNYISLVKGNIYGTNFFNSTVKCYTLSGELLWTFKHENIDKPTGIALDKHGFMYVVCRISNKIVVFSPDRKSCRTILNHDNGMKAPQSIDIDMKSELMLISSSKEDLDPLLFKL